MIRASIVSAAFAATTQMAAAAVVASDAATLGDRVRAHTESRQVEILRELAALVAIPNLASDASRIRENVAAIAAMLERRGVATRLLEVESAPPAVYGELNVAGASRTVVFYAHYDGQPVDPTQWTGNPWTPVLRDGRLEDGAREIPLGAWKSALGPEWRLYGRSASDDKAPIVGLMAALDALRAAGAAPSVNLKFLFEGEEEAGSPHMQALLAAHGALLKADAWLLCDGPVHQTRRMQLYFGARGITDVEITVYGPVRPLHSGHYGNWAPNPAVVLAHLIAGLRDRDGRILVPGFYDDVREATPAERQALAETPDVDRELMQALGLGGTEGGPLADRILLPALNVRGLASGAVGPSA
ncbi:MAG TPA: M20/M25/M40 family metallo-hydrolase, partial [Vicinamibacteria bacterium]|nr:M20/M25/M40 family metallo-hydrolase [Vicinamibacteria bacterium]